MSIKANIGIAVASAALGLGVLSAVQPRSPQEAVDNQRDQQVQQLSDSEEANQERLRQQGLSGIDADRTDRARPVQPRGVHPHLRMRLP